MAKERDKQEKKKAKPITLAPLDFQQAVRGLLAVKPARKKSSKKR